MEKTIFNVCVKLKSKQQLKRLLDACESVGLPTITYNDFKKGDFFRKGIGFGFANWIGFLKTDTQVTEAEFINLLKEYKKTLTATAQKEIGL